ncbi:TPA: hypothetical protein JI054_15925 [Acinetobacter baumannii]|uniref:hypothetical protein n=1 Tax=Acinetobacter baumannii TaxID=470 RepID=UPI00028D08D6|nr:hypothetical protein [Acinetobacter baumannii]AGQ05424.1 hypothetical protein BJAB0715_00778 [Acinetobacter baumannii BJAB0715]AIY38419.1 hypothetical protein ABLAC_30640 [Acinetobacter baumannii LAC-4]AKQ31671.1 hypothetical protein ACX61_15065 [Acinetobacter baumannii]AMN00369.1 hypothetical protein AZE33_03975 [Acinetobacter baumannii]APO58191.1 hypothetical protein BBX32_06370 [Acinetobacter baumannii]
MRQFTSLQVAILALGSLCFSSAYAGSTLVPMTDAELSATRGQALMSMSYIAPNDSANLEKLRDSSSNVGFFKLSLDADVELNTNIRKLQLGCGGANGAGACDIDIDNLSLSGLSNTNDGRASSSAKITNPFIEFAIKNPNSTALREVTGLRVSAEAIEGLLTFGTENSQTKNGINSFSGYMVTQATGGSVSTAARPTGSGLTQANLGTQITGRAKGTLIGLDVINTNFRSTSYDLGLSSASGSLFLPSQVISGKRINAANLTGTANVSGINLSGSIKADTDLIISIAGNLSGTINNLGVNVAVNEDLGYFHKVNLNGTAASLSLQAQNLQWPGAKSVSQGGWWLELSNPIDIGDVTPQSQVVITDDVVKATLGKVSQYLTNNPVNCGTLALDCVLGNIDVSTVDLTGQYVPMNLSNLVLKNQTFASNCHGADVKFC